MTDQTGRQPEERLPAPRPSSAPVPAQRFSAPPSAHRNDLTPERAARIVRQSASARWVGFLAVTTNTHLLLPLICGINVLEAGSVALQMGVFKASGRKKRLFRMSPIHHHFELLGWHESQVIVRFWILSIMLALFGLAILKIV